MKKSVISAAVGSAVALASTAAFAAPFSSFDPRSMGMGGAGVAVGNAATAPLFNPALLGVTAEDDDFALDVIGGVRLYDPEDFVGSVDDFQQDPAIFTAGGDFKLTTSINDFNASKSQADAARVVTNISDLNAGLKQISDKLIQEDLGGGVVAAVPAKRFGFAITGNAWAALSGVVHYRDEAVLTEVAAVADCYAQTALTPECTTLVANSQYVDANGINFDPQRDLDSTVEVRGLLVREVGLSMAHELGDGSDTYVLGLTPKYVIADVVDYVVNAENANEYELLDKQNVETYKHFNADIGLAKNFGNGWRTGLVVKNVVAKEFETTQGRIIKMNPQARIGIARQTDWTTLALDVDLTENEPVNFEEKTRYVSLGAEFNALDWAQLRVGYRANTVDSARDVISAGVGLSPFGLHVDIGVAGNKDELGASIQAGYRF